MRVLVLNSGSSSIKYCVYDMGNESLLVSGKIDRIGGSGSSSVFRIYTASGNIKENKKNVPVADHTSGLKLILTLLEKNNQAERMDALFAIGHRVVHGGDIFQESVLISDEVIDKIRNTIPLAPLHNPVNLAGIETMRHLCPQVPQVAVFDSAFFRSLPAHSYRYALPENMFQYHIRRYGFHGISHHYVARQAADILHQTLETLRLITLHLGNGASAAAIREGVCIDTSMGMTPLEGLIMGTRCGDIDPSIHFYLARSLGMNFDEIELLLNNESGLKGLCGVSDMREVHRLANDGNEQARLAIDMYCYRIVKYVGAYYAILGGLDALVFTAGIGEHDPMIRQSICKRLSVLSINLNDKRNQDSASIISDGDSPVKVLVIRTNEELEIARQTVSIMNRN